VGIQFVFTLIFDEEGRIVSFASVVEQRADAHQHAVRADGFGGLLRQVGYQQAVLVRPGSVAQDVLQQWMVRTGDVQQLQRGGNIQDLGHHVLEQEGKAACGKSID